MITTSARAGSSLIVRMLADRRCGRAQPTTLPRTFQPRGADVRAVVFAGAGGNEVIRLEERPDPVPGSEELLVRVTHAGLNPADLSQRDGLLSGAARKPAGRPRARGRRHRRGLRRAGARLEAGRSRLRPGRRRRARRPRARASALRRARAGRARRAAARRPSPRRSSRRTTPSAARPALRTGEMLLVHGAAGGVGSAAAPDRRRLRRARARHRAQRRCGRARA